MSGKVRTAQFPSDLNEQYEEYRKQKDLSKSEALRSLVRKGLDHEGQESQFKTDGKFILQWLITVGSVSAVTSILALAVATRLTAAVLAVVAIFTNLAALWIRNHA
jgi:pheromone shutdown protein TraB